MGSNRRQNDVVIIGAGVVGSSIAYHLARHKLRVTLLERRHIASGSSGACDGMVFLQSKKPGVHLELAMESRRRFQLLSRQLPVPIEYKPTGGMVVIETEVQLAAMERFVRAQRESGLEVALLTGAQARRIEPRLSSHTLGATHCPLDGQVNPMALTLGFALGARALGVRVVTGVNVLGLDTAAGRISAVETTAGRFEAHSVVNAAGVRAPDIGDMAGVTVPIEPRRGQILVTEACRPMVSHCLLSAEYIAAKYNPGLAAQNSQGVSMEQTQNGNLLLGSTREFVGHDRRTTIRGLQHIAAGTAGLIPALKQVKVIRAFAGLRPYTPDGLPILGPVEEVPGLVMATGHEGDGIALSPITGELIAQLIATGRSDIPLDAFCLERFADQKKRVEAAHG